MNALAVVQQTELGLLVDKRESLQRTITNLKRAMRKLRPFDAAAEEKSRKEAIQNIRRNLRAAQDQLAAYEEAERERRRLLALTDNDKVQDLLRDRGYNGFKWWIERQQSDIQGYNASLEREQKRQIQDPRIKLSNSLADAESALSEVKRSIKRIMEN